MSAGTRQARQAQAEAEAAAERESETEEEEKTSSLTRSLSHRLLLLSRVCE